MNALLTRNDRRLLFKIVLMVAVFVVTIAAMGKLLGRASDEAQPTDAPKAFASRTPS